MTSGGNCGIVIMYEMIKKVLIIQEEMMDNKISLSAMTELLQKLVSISSPYFHEDEIMDYVKGWLEERGLPAQLHTYHDSRVTGFHGTNVTGVLDGGKPGPVIYLNGHLDTVNICDGWTKDPLGGQVEDGKLYGTGALDMKSGCAAILLAVEAFAAEHKEFNGKIIYHLVSDEEGPYGLGTMFLIDDQWHRVEEIADIAISTEPTAGFSGRPHPCVGMGAKGGYNYKIIVRGKSSHAATPHLGVSAAVDASKIVVELEAMEKRSDPQLGKGANCVIRLASGGAACSVPDYAEIEIFSHVVRGENQQTLREEAEEAIRRAGVRSQCEIVFRDTPVDRFDGGFPPYCADADNEYVKRFLASVAKTCGTEPQISYFEAIGDFNYVGGTLGIPTVMFGASGDHFHSCDEYVCLDSITEVAETLYRYFAEVLV